MKNMLVYEPRPFFKDRRDAGERLAEKLIAYTASNPVVLAIPRGGVPVALEIAKRLKAIFDVLVVRKIQIPWQTEAGYGAISDDGTVVLNERLVASLGLSPQQIQQGADEVKDEIARRTTAYRGAHPFPLLAGKVVMIVDDGLASGFTMIAAIKSAKRRNAQKVIAVAPVASKHAFDNVKQTGDDVACLVVADSPWFAVASFYENWYDLSEQEVLTMLREWRAIDNKKGKTL